MATLAQKLSERTRELKEKKDYIKQLEDIVASQSNEIGELNLIVQKWEDKQKNGYTALLIENDMIMKQVNVPPGSTFAYTQDISKDINTALYKNYPYLYLGENGKIEIDNQKFNKFKRSVIL